MPNGSGGYLVLTEPWPAMLRTLWGDDERFKDTYWSRFEQGIYFAGDGAKKDEDGDIWLLGRVDDVMNVSGHRLSTTEIESALVSHPKVAEAAVVGADGRGHRPGGLRVRDPARVAPATAARTSSRSCATTCRRRSARSPSRARSWSSPSCRRPAPARSCAACSSDVAEHREVGDVTTLADSTVMDLISEGVDSGKSTEESVRAARDAPAPRRGQHPEEEPVTSTPAALLPDPEAAREHLRRHRAAPGDRRRGDRAGGRGGRGGVGQLAVRRRYEDLRHLQLGPLDLEHWAADGALALFFFLAGLELKRELLVGSLRRPADAAGARSWPRLRGRVPALVYLAVNLAAATADPRAGRSRPPPTSRSRSPCSRSSGRALPSPLRAFLLTLAVVDDLVVIVIIAVFYTSTLHLCRCCWRAGAARGVRVLQRLRVDVVPWSTSRSRWPPGGACTRAASTRPSPASRSGC